MFAICHIRLYIPLEIIVEYFIFASLCSCKIYTKIQSSRIKSAIFMGTWERLCSAFNLLFFPRQFIWPANTDKM